MALCITGAAFLLFGPRLDASDAIDHRQLLWYIDGTGMKRAVDSASTWKQRRELILKGMQEVMGPLPERSKLPPLAMKTKETVQGDGYKRHSIVFENVHAERITAYLYVPDGLKPGEKRPGVVALHPTGPQGKEIIDGQSPRGMSRGYGLELALRGYVVIAPDYPSFGDQKDYDFIKSPYASGTMKAISDNMRCIDLLQSRDEVDPAKIACIGHSLGGHNALFTAAFDERIAVVVTSCGWTPFHYYYEGKKLMNWAHERYMPRMRNIYQSDPDMQPFDFIEVVAAIAPRSVYSNSPVNDHNFEVAGVRAGIMEVEKIYTLFRASENLVVRYPDYGHDFQEESRREAYRFIDRHAGYIPTREVP